ncbi:MAG: DUF4390 domain-containing protein [Deltaproteobacteria bacterium]|nr:DUF4390 domain-containing protein [Deltaproteobacteria bacterium]
MKVLRTFFACIGVIVFALSSASFAEDAAIRDISISNSSAHLHLRFRLANTFSPRMEEAINDGIPAVFTFYVELFQERSIRGDNLISSFSFTKTLKYNALKKEYTITEQNNKGNGDIAVELSTLHEAKKQMNSINIPSLYPMWKLDRNKNYYFRIKAESKGIEPPLFLNYLLFFLKWMNFETPWVVERFSY